MFRKIFLVIILNLLFLVSIANAQIFEDSKNGYSLEIPEHWKVTQTKPNNVFSEKNNQGVIIISFLPSYPFARSENDDYFILKKGTDMFIQKFNGAVIESIKVDKIANQEAVVAIFSYPVKDENQGKIMLAHFWVNDLICEVVLFAKPGKYEELKPSFLSTLNSFKLHFPTAYEWASKGHIYQKKHEYDKAIDAFSNAAKLDVKNTEYIYQIAYTNSEKGDYNQAITAMSKAIELKPKESFYYHERAYAHIKLKNAQQALDDENKAIQINPQKAIFYAGRGNAYAIMGNFEEAVTDFQKCLELKGSPLDSTFNLGQTYDLMGKHEEALKYYKMIVESPNLPEPIKAKVQARMNGDWNSYKEWI